jgi:hypothetical protein
MLSSKIIGREVRTIFWACGISLSGNALDSIGLTPPREAASSTMAATGSQEGRR